MGVETNDDLPNGFRLVSLPEGNPVEIEDVPVDFNIGSVKDLLDSEDRVMMENAIVEASQRLMRRLTMMDQVLLYATLSTGDKLGLSPLHISNIYNYMIGGIGQIKRLKTKAWDRSRKKVGYMKKLLANEVKEVVREWKERREI